MSESNAWKIKGAPPLMWQAFAGILQFCQVPVSYSELIFVCKMRCFIKLEHFQNLKKKKFYTIGIKDQKFHFCSLLVWIDS